MPQISAYSDLMLQWVS